MNIFSTYNCPKLSAQALDDKRVIKMILESAQMLCTAIHLHSKEDNNIINTQAAELYKSTHVKHPCTIWTAYSIENWMWLYDHIRYLCEEYSYRFNNRVHKVESKFIPSILEYKYLLPEKGLTKFANCCRGEFKNGISVDYREIDDVLEAYRLYMCAKWQNDARTPIWTKRRAPKWYLI